MATKYYGYAGKYLRIKLSKKKSETSNLERNIILDYLGGRGFNSKRLYDEIAPGLDPLSPRNKIMFSTGPFVGTVITTASRFNVSAKSPLTGILGDSNAGGHFAAELKYAGYDQVILEEKGDSPIYIFIDDGRVEILDANHLWGKDIYEADEIIKKELNDRTVQTAIVGPAAENGVTYAGVFVNLMRPAGRTGMGTVMASKKVKAIAVRGSKSIEIAKPRKLEKLVEEIEEEIFKNPQYWPRRRMGTTRILLPINVMGFLPTRHFTSGEFEHAEAVSGEELAEKYNVKVRGCFSCIAPCSRFYVVKEGKYSGLCGEGPEYEPLSAFTARVGNPDLQVALKAIDLVNRFGLDAISTAECIAWAMELFDRKLLNSNEADGLDLTWGNEETILSLISKIAMREGFGDILADGVKKAAEKLRRGHDIAFHVKGLEIIQADPRGLKGYGLGYAVASRGGDHLRSEPFVEVSDDPNIGERLFGIPDATLRLAYRGKGKLVKYFEDWCAVIDSLEVCKNIMENMEILTFDKAAEVMEACTGIKLSASQVETIGERVVNLERCFIVREGIRRKDDTLPKRFLDEPMPRGYSKGSIFELEHMLNEYYQERGWNQKTGIPSGMKLKELDLGYVAEDLKKYE